MFTWLIMQLLVWAIRSAGDAAFAKPIGSTPVDVDVLAKIPVEGRKVQEALQQ